MRRAGLIIGGALALGGSAAAFLISRRTATKVKDAVEGIAPPALPGTSNTIEVHLTCYWPFEAGLTAAERKMEGDPVDRKKNPLHTVEDFLAGKSDHVSLAGDYTIFPYGQKILIPWGDKTLVGRVTDTGGHFHGAGKLFRVLGAEPIDVCVFSKDLHPPKTTVDAQVVIGDTLDKTGSVAQLDKAGKPQVVGLLGLDLFTTRSES
jgi:hypothetical protein